MEESDSKFSLSWPPLKRCNSQVSLSCRLCNGRQNLKWRCMNCKFTICEKCKDIHSRIPSTSGHIVVTFEDIATCNIDLRLENLIKKMFCQKHPRRTYKFFCQSCDFLVCTDCMFENHSAHQVIEINRFLTEKFTEESTERLTEGLKRKSFSDSGFEDIMADCPEWETDNLKTSITKSEDSFCLLMTEFQVIHTVTTNLPTINFIVPISEDTMWIGGIDGNIISKVNLNKTFFTKKFKRSNSKQIDQIEGFQPLDISINCDEDILFVCKYDKCVKLVKTNSHGQKQVCDIRNFFPLEPICIHCEQDNEHKVWIGLTEGGPDFELSEKSTRQVVEITQTGKLCNIYEYTRAGKRLFTLPWRIINTQDGNICVIDRVSQTRGRVISLNKTGHLMWIYNDPRPSFSRKPFFPTDMVVTSSRNIIVADMANSALHILNEQGVLILHQSLLSLGIEQPFSLNTDESRHLWVGCTCNINSIEKKAKMYELEISGL